MTATYDKYVGNPAENYERYFVPRIGVPCAGPLIETLHLQEGDRVLDLACGTGVAGRIAAERVGRTGTVVGVDAHPGMLAVAREHVPEGPATAWHEATAENLPLEDDSFDAVVCSLGFQFFADKAAALREMRRVLAPGGRVTLGAPGPTPPLFQAIDQALTNHVGPDASMFVHAVFSVHDPEEVRQQLAAAGFEQVEVTTSPLPLRVGAPADFLWQYVHSTPLAGIVTKLDDAGRKALEDDVVERCQPFLDGDDLTMAPNLLVTAARKPTG